jgi:hypothetical protein
MRSIHGIHGIHDGWDNEWARRRLGREARGGGRTGAWTDTLDAIGDIVAAQFQKPSSSPSLAVSHSGGAERIGQGDEERRSREWGWRERGACLVTP